MISEAGYAKMSTHGIFASSHLTKKTDTPNKIQRTPTYHHKIHYFFTKTSSKAELIL